MYLSVDENPKQWDRMSETLGLNEFQNYRTTFDSALGKILLADRTVPRYLIIGKAATVRSFNPPAPVSQAYVTVLEKLAGER